MTLTPTAPNPDGIDRCVAALRSGHLAIIPTDTVYGICADASNDEAVRAIYAAKGKGNEAPLQLLFAPELLDAHRVAALNDSARRLIDVLGPGGWTIIVPASEDWHSPALAGGRTVGIRVPRAEAVHAVARVLGGPLAASSANRHGQRSPLTCEEAVGQVGGACTIALDGGPITGGIDSTVIDVSDESQPRIVREGAIDRQTVARILGLTDIPVLRSVRL